MNTLSLVRGTSQDFQLQIFNLDGTLVTTYLGSDAISSRLWRGDSTTVLVTFPFLGNSTSGVTGTSWITPGSGTFQISFNDLDTAALQTGQYRIQTVVTRSFRTTVVFDGVINLTDSPGSVAPTSLVSPDYVQASLQANNLTANQNLLLTQLISAASRLIRKHCNRWFTRRPSSDGSLAAYDGLYTLDWPSKTLVLRQFPVNGILRVRTNPTQVFNVTNGSAANQQATATLTWTGVQDISDIAPVTTGMRLWSLASGVPTTVNLLFSTYTTFQSLATAINAIGNGWSASTVGGKYALWPTADLRQGVGPSCAIGAYAQQGFWVHTDDVPVQVDQEAGILKLDAGSDDPWSSSRFGTYLDTGLGDLDIGGGLNGVRVMYDAGWDTVPEDVQQACVETVQDMLNLISLDQRLQSESDGSYSYDLSKIDRYALIPSVRGKLGYYQNIRS